MFIDVHSHLDQYEKDLQAALEEIGLNTILTISNSMDPGAYERAVELSKQCSLVLPIFGLHPWNAYLYCDSIDDYDTLIHQSPMLGEIGLDHHFIKEASKQAAQQKVFEYFLTKAKEQDKIAIIHTKGAEKEVLRALDRYQIRRAIIHWYSGPTSIFNELVTRGYYFTIGTAVLYSKHIQRLARKMPAERLLTETDNPGAWEWAKGEPGMPRLIIDVYRAIAELRETTVEHLIRTVQTNFSTLIRDDSALTELATMILVDQLSDQDRI